MWEWYLNRYHSLMHVAQRLSEARGRAGLTLRELAVLAETSHSTLAAYESGSKVPTTRTLLRILSAAGFAVDLELNRRWRGTPDTLPRGEELQQVLELAEQFPARHSRKLAYPIFAHAQTLP